MMIVLTVRETLSSDETLKGHHPLVRFILKRLILGAPLLNRSILHFLAVLAPRGIFARSSTNAPMKLEIYVI